MTTTLDRSVEIAAPAGQVWELVSTSAGLSGWFVDATVVPGPQGNVTLRFAPGAEGTVPILVWDPPRRIRFGIPDGGRVHDIKITATATGSQVQLQDEGVEDDQADATAAGWAGFLGKLRSLAEKLEVRMDLEEARRRLLAEQAQLRRSLGLVEESGQEDRAAETADGPHDQADEAQPLAAEYEDDSIAESLRDRLNQVGRALRRVDERTWGRSVRSGVPIPPERLEADPAAELTVEEAAEQEQAAGH